MFGYRLLYETEEVNEQLLAEPIYRDIGEWQLSLQLDSKKIILIIILPLRSSVMVSIVL